MALVECRDSGLLLAKNMQGAIRIHRLIPGVAGIAVRHEEREQIESIIDFHESHPDSWLRFVSDDGWVIDEGKVVLGATIAAGIKIFSVTAAPKLTFDCFELLRAYERTMLAR